MLGRYIAGTLLILGVAMMVAPDAPERPENKDVPVARANTSPIALASVGSKQLAEASEGAGFLQPAVAEEKTEDLVSASFAGQEIQAGVEAALLQALALDETEGAQLEVADATDTEATDADANVFAGLDLTLAVTDEPASPSLQVARAPRTMFVTGSRVNVRSGPSTQYRVVGTVANGDPVELISFEGASWARIRFENGDTTGYMSREFLAGEDNNG
ncbi:SH3 domain-containing protein [Tropicimonas sp. TH_r6]|uniref:SH3 domain-containing protein n=1 Tax=Tropicimonas sp. TH_r6 TaxID=3082085 RepID=UPI0029530039|nr:SH3 domain-containing protein [Tropicimonas sp. TH_r6]MDV7142422.1 SH3 domain-containing protein [Tropicimonas sp. TH_r6]